MIRWPSTSSASHSFSRGHSRASASCDSCTDSSIGREQARIDQPIDDLRVGVVDRDPRALDPTRYHRTVRGRLDETEEDVAQQPLAVRRERREHLFRGLRDGTVDLTGCPIPVDGHDAALTTGPHLTQSVRQQRKGSPIGVADEDLDETRLQDESGLLCGLLDHGSQPVGARAG